MAYTARHPERVAHLIIADSAAPSWIETDIILNCIYPESVKRQSRYDALDAVVELSAHSASLVEYLGLLCVSRELSDALVAMSDKFTYTREINERLNADVAQKDLLAALPSFDMPTLVVTGSFDMNVAPSIAWKIHKAISGSRFVVFEKSGHLPFYEAPDGWIETFGGFLSGE